MSLFGIYELTEHIKRLRDEIQADREARTRERYGMRTPTADDMTQYNRSMGNNQFVHTPEPKVCIPQSSFDKMNAELKKNRKLAEHRLKLMLEESHNTTVARQQCDIYRQEVTTLQLDAKIKQEQNLRLANRVNDLELQLKAALDGKANPGTAQGPSSEEEGRLPSGDEQAPVDAGK